MSLFPWVVSDRADIRRHGQPMVPSFQPSRRASICTIVLNWGRPVETLACLETLLPFVRRGVTALAVCDNGSSDDSVSRIRSWAEGCFQLASDGERAHDWDFILIRSSENRGFAAGNNLAIARAMAAGFRYLWILNNDTEVAPDALDALARYAERHRDALIIGSTVVDFDRRDRVQYAGGARYFPPLTRVSNPLRGRSLSALLEQTQVPRIDYVVGCSLFCRTEVFERFGLLDERFFLYFEELDLARRLPRRRRQLHWCRDSIVFHREGSSSGGRSNTNACETPFSSYHENLSALLYTHKHHKRWLPIAFPVRFVAKFLILMMNRRFRLLAPLFGAYVDFLRCRAGHARPRSGDVVVCWGRRY